LIVVLASGMHSLSPDESAEVRRLREELEAARRKAEAERRDEMFHASWDS
jgi:hypothetical protein